MAISSNLSIDPFTEIRYFASIEAFVFLANFSANGIIGANATTLLPAKPTRLNPNWNVPLSSAFPSWPAPSPPGCAYISYHGNSLGRNFRAGPLSEWQGGLEGGPLLVYPTEDSSSHPPAMLMSPLTHPKVGE